jgi:hypothetical protein
LTGDLHLDRKDTIFQIIVDNPPNKAWKKPRDRKSLWLIDKGIVDF